MPRMSNEDVLKKVNESRNMLNVMWQQKHRWIGHVLRHDGFLQEILEGRMIGKPTGGKRRTQLFNDLIDKKDYVAYLKSELYRSTWRTTNRRGMLKAYFITDPTSTS